MQSADFHSVIVKGSYLLPRVLFVALKVLSAVQVQSLARAVVRGGGVTQPLGKLASIGKDGHFKGNAYRDMLRFTGSRLPFFDSVQPYHFSAPCPRIKKAGLSKVSVYAALPHEVFATVFTVSQRLFHDIFNTEGITEFWERESATRAIPQGDLTRVVPIRFWGDDSSHCKT